MESTLAALVRSWGQVTIAFSGGVDSSLLASVAHEQLGGQALAVTARTEFTAGKELEAATKTARAIGIAHRVIDVELLDERMATHPRDRCYHCKRRILSALPGPLIADGTHADDDSARPGMQALAEYGVRSPLRELGLGKQDVRALARKRGIPAADAPSDSCLATRLPFHTCLTRKRLAEVERIESVLHAHGIGDVRARILNEPAQLEIPQNALQRYREHQSAIDAAIGQPYQLAYRECGGNAHEHASH